jgi:glycosyltransferase involved in cell wall biosynthesis
VRIAIIADVFLPKIDGVVGRTLNLIQQLHSHGDEVVVVCPEVPGDRNSPVPLIEFRGFPCSSYPEYIIGRPDSSLVERLREFRPDVIHFLNPFAFGFQCSDLLNRSDLRIPQLFSFHTLYGEFVKRYAGLNLLSPVLWWLMRRYHNTAALNLTVSSVMVQMLETRGFHQVALWPPAVDSELFSPHRRTLSMRDRLNPEHPDRPLLLTVSRLASEKNVEFLAKILDRVPEASLAIVGGGPQRAELERTFRKRSAHFVGYLKGVELAEAYASADAFVYASETETMGNVVLEAMASGLPVIAADACGVSSLVEHGVDGFLFAPGDAVTAAEYVREALDSAETRDRMSAAARNSAAKRTWTASGGVVREHYRRLMNRDTAFPSGRSASAGMLPAVVTRALVKSFELSARMVQRKQPNRMPVAHPQTET